MPRMIDRRLGQELLGIWDFAWSLVSYFSLVQVGVQQSVNRYVARYRATGDILSVNRAVSSAFCIQGAAGLVTLGLTATVCLLLPVAFGSKLGENVREAQWVVLFLGCNVGVDMAFRSFSGVITGCHRWGLHNLIKSGWHTVTVAGMIVILMLGGPLRSLAAVVLVGMALACATRVIVAHVVCKVLRVRASFVGWETAKELFAFGGKSMIPAISNLLLNQTISVLIVSYLGPAALALYARPRSLILHMNTLAQKMAMILTPTISSLQSIEDLAGIRHLLLKSVRYSLYLTLPMVLVLAIFGGPILRFWMGPRYANGLVPAILAIGYLAALAQAPVFMVLVGLNAHGRAGMASLVASVCSIGLTVLGLGYLRWGLLGAALGVTVPLTLINIAYLPFLVCRRVNLHIGRYFAAVATGPAVHLLPLAICLALARLLSRTEPLMGLLVGGGTGGAITTVLYWRYVLPERLKAPLSRLYQATATAVRK